MKLLSHFSLSILLSALTLVFLPFFGECAEIEEREYRSAAEQLRDEAAAFLSEIEVSKAAAPMFREKIRAALDGPGSVCPVDFAALVDSLDVTASEVSAAMEELKKLLPERDRIALLLAEAESKLQTDYAFRLKLRLENIDARISDADAMAAEILPESLSRFIALFDRHKGISCPKGMVFIDGTFCVDAHEAPNKEGERPATGLSWVAAAKFCEEAGKRLCEGGEWARACAGPACAPNRINMPDFNASACNAALNMTPAVGVYPSGSRPECVSPEGVADIFGNAWEWTNENYKDRYKTLRGGSGSADPAPTCENSGWGLPGTSRSYSGARCCADPAVQPPPSPAPEQTADDAPQTDTEKSQPPQ
ncbi:MAG TPA: SUMF1/EgtB/PvdO family nonheme iron enzyme [bacterium]|nr:MAG: Formylglycine-generating sulfatase enzyme [bacterium ADurb.Bin236]HOY62601.1 SUMF1/EgtB/PvdO family nonheme iron enzyme [bacterium]HPI76608.1 SUMF1/EgtB/PvdO family nonheme iron enzyme [bacterium]HPN95885.1 SUMF1/EgtB/PvdO family nonheme iron enzyme [bacterium]